MTTWLCPGTKCTNQVTGSQICDDCYVYLADMLDQLGPLWMKLRALLPKGSRVAERVSVSVVGSQAPFNMTVFDTTAEIYELMLGWDRTIRVREGDPITGSLSEVRRFTQARLYLLRNRHTLQDSHLLTQFYNAIYFAHRRLVQLAGDCPDTQRIPRPCPTCSAMTLISRHVGDYVTCLTCSGRWGQAAYLGLNRRSAVVGQTSP